MCSTENQPQPKNFSNRIKNLIKTWGPSAGSEVLMIETIYMFEVSIEEWKSNDYVFWMGNP